MPIRLGTTLKINNDKLNVIYTDLYNKLNSSKSWKNTINNDEIVYTTQYPQIGNNIYDNCDLKVKTIIKRVVGDNTIVGENGMIYVLNDKNSISFNKIPQELYNEPIMLGQLLELLKETE